MAARSGSLSEAFRSEPEVVPQLVLSLDPLFGGATEIDHRKKTVPVV